MTLAAELCALGTATLAEAWPVARLLDPSPRPLAMSMRAAGPALPVRCRPGDNLALHRAIAAAEEGDILVVDYGGACTSGPLGEIMALACQMRGVAGFVSNGAVRDSVQIAALGFPVFCAGINIRGTTKTDRGIIGEPVVVGGITVRRGDFVVADADAVIVIDADGVMAACDAGKARADKEAAMMERLRKGETTLQILGLSEGPA